MRVGLGTPTKANPGSGIDYVVSGFSTETWLTSQVNGRQTDRIASAWSWDEPGTTLRLTLRQDVFFHDGTRLTPELGVQALQASMKERTAPSSFSSIRSIQASGEHTIDITLSEPNSFFLPDLSVVSLKKPGVKAEAPLIGTGPFRIVRTDAQQATLQAFDRYYRGQPAIATMEVINYPTQRNAWAALMRGEIDMLYEVGRDAAGFVAAESAVRTYSSPRPYYNALVFNVRHPILKQAEVRRALNQALDRPTLISDGLNGKGRPANGPLFPEHWAYSAQDRSFSFDPASARLRLEEIGLRTKPGVDGRMPSRFSFTCIVYGNDPRFERLAVLIQKQLAEVGVDMRLQPLPLDELGKRVGLGEFDAILMEFNGRSLGWVHKFWRSRDPGLLSTGYRSADAVLDRIKAARSDEEIRHGVAELGRILNDDPPAAFLAWQETSRAVSTKFDVGPENARDIISNVWKWRPAGTLQAAR
jgi:peptide/nickel transport system substrate-binding protein